MLLSLGSLAYGDDQPSAPVPADPASQVAAPADATSAQAAALQPSQPTLANAETIDPGLQNTGSTLTSDGALVGSTLAKDPAQGFTLGFGTQALSVTPVGVAGSAGSANVVNETAAVFSNVQPGTDSVERPTALGVETFQELHNGSAPQTFSWKIDLKSGQHLAKLNNNTIAVVGAQRQPQPDVITEPAATAQSTGADDSSSPAAADAGTPPTDGDTGTRPNAPTDHAASSLPWDGHPATSASTAEAASEANSTAPAAAASSTPSDPPGGATSPDSSIVSATPAGPPQDSTAASSADPARATSSPSDVTDRSSQKAEGQVADAQAQLATGADQLKAAEAQTADKTVAMISATWAKDASGNDVPVSLSTDGNTITMSVQHADGQTAYPVVADPTFEALPDPEVHSDGANLDVSGVALPETVAKDPAHGVTIDVPGQPITATPQNLAPDAAHAATVNDGSAVAFANTQAATDTIVEPGNFGAETMTVLGDNSAPEDYSWQIAPPGGSTMSTQPDGSVAIVDQAGNTTAAIPAPWAHDAEGQNVPVSFSVDGTNVTMHVAHRENHYAYPIVADPALNWYGAQDHARRKRQAEEAVRREEAHRRSEDALRREQERQRAEAQARQREEQRQREQERKRAEDAARHAADEIRIEPSEPDAQLPAFQADGQNIPLDDIGDGAFGNLALSARGIEGTGTDNGADSTGPEAPIAQAARSPYPVRCSGYTGRVGVTGYWPGPNTIKFVARQHCSRIARVKFRAIFGLYDGFGRLITTDKCNSIDRCNISLTRHPSTTEYTTTYYIEGESLQTIRNKRAFFVPAAGREPPGVGCITVLKVNRCAYRFRFNVEEHRCEPTRPLRRDPAPERADNEASRYQPYRPDPFVDSSGSQAFFRFGRFIPTISNPFQGFGWRHVAAKHGWGPADDRATQEAVSNPVKVEIQGTSRNYFGPAYRIHGAECQRVVVAAYGQTQREADLGLPAKGIVTSYGRPIDPR